MKKLLFTFFMFSVCMFFTACPQKSSKPAAPKTIEKTVKVRLPITAVKGKDNILKTQAFRQGFKYLADQTATPTGTTITHSLAEHFLEWDIAASFDKEVDAFSPALVIKHVRVKSQFSGDNNTVTLTYNELKQWLGRDIHVGDNFWLSFRCINHNGDEIGRLHHHIEITNPAEVKSIKMLYGFDAYYLKAVLTGKYPTATADFYLGADEKAQLIKEKVNGQVSNNETVFICKIQGDKVVKGQPYHARLTFKDIEYSADGLERETNFEGGDIVYSETASSAWNFQIDDIALAKERENVHLETADPKIKWNKMSFAAALYNDIQDNSIIKNEKYIIRAAASESDLNKADPKTYKVTVGTNQVEADLSGLQFSKKYFVQVEYSYDIKEANSLARKEHKSPVISFTTVEGLISPVYTFDSGREINGTPSGMPSTLSTNGTIAAQGGNPGRALKLEGTTQQNIKSEAVRRYNSAEFSFDMILPGDFINLLNNISIGSSYVKFYDKKTNKLPSIENRGTTLWEFTSGSVKAKLVFMPPYFETADDDYNDSSSHNWTLTQGKVVIAADGGNGSAQESGTLFESETSVKDSLGASVSNFTGKTYTDLYGYTKTTQPAANIKSWVAPYAVKISLSKENIKAEIGKKSVSASINSLLEKINGFESIELKVQSALSGMLVDNVKFEIKDGDSYIRSL